MKPLLITIKIPEHQPGKVPNHIEVGRKLDNLIKQHFLGKSVVIRCIGSQDHVGININKLTEILLKTGTDKYDEKRTGVGYQEFINKGIPVDFYGEPAEITKDTIFMGQAIWEMHHSALGDRGYGVHVDMVLLYDKSKVDMVMNLYDYQPTSDGYVFKDPHNKQAALLGVVKLSY
jgi:hypothetical protein